MSDLELAIENDHTLLAYGTPEQVFVMQSPGLHWSEVKPAIDFVKRHKLALVTTHSFQTPTMQGGRCNAAWYIRPDLRLAAFDRVDLFRAQAEEIAGTQRMSYTNPDAI